ncbi:hypothetical protein OAS47_05335 [Pelagibacteraceae bacterium]|nr:hypothetical protein [Pelagibacteraceae bacterium]
MKKFLEDFKKLDMPARFIMVGTLIGMVGYFFGEGENSDFWDAIMWIGSSIGIFGWVWLAFK